MQAENHDRRPQLPFVCAECSHELVLTSSGHQFCANRWCKEGFEVMPDWRMMTVVELFTEGKKRQ
jgi:hypothetical protein